jgi:hypothetical protein
MRRIVILMGLFTASGCFAQEQPPNLPPQPPPSQGTVQGDSQKKEIMIPAGTRVPVTLTNPIRSKSSHRGDPVRAITAFPVTIGTQLAIPAGSYVEGTIVKVTKPDSSGNPGLEVHFTRIVFTNGYSVPLEAGITQARLDDPDANSSVASISDDDLSLGAASGFQQLPGQTLPPLPPLPKPKIGVAVGIAVGAAAVGIVAAILLGHHRGAGDYVIYDVGSQFDMVLTGPVTLDAERVAAAVNPIQ